MRRRLRSLAVVATAVAAVAACNAVLDIPEAGHLPADGGVVGVIDGSPVVVPDSSSHTCASGTKGCGDQCVGFDVPANGCGAASCSPCAVANATAACGDGGACVVGTCNDGFKDCDGKPENGCEVDIRSDSANCGDCTSPCAGALTCVNRVCGCDTSIQCGLAISGDDGDIVCGPGRLCQCFGETCDPGSNCDIDDMSCN